MMINKISLNNFDLSIIYEDEMDYYTDVQIVLSTDRMKEIIYDDNILHLKNIVMSSKTRIFNISDMIEEDKLGIHLNDFYFNQYQETNIYDLKYDEMGEWVGMKYCIDVGKENAVWLYRFHDQIYLNITPVFHIPVKKANMKYQMFRKQYRDVFKTTVSREDLYTIEKKILEMYQQL